MSDLSQPNPPMLHHDSAIGDLIIRTADGANFHVHKDVMCRASPVFETMLSLPQSRSSAHKAKPVVDVQEGSAVWENIIPLCYFSAVPTHLDDLDLVHSLLEAGRKYEAKAIVDCVRQALQLPKFAKDQALSVYALACAYDLDDIARIAAVHTLALPIYLDFPKELNLISLHSYHALSVYRKRCGISACAVTGFDRRFGAPNWLSQSESAKSCLQVKCGNDKTCRKDAFRISPFIGNSKCYRHAWGEYFDDLTRTVEFQPDAGQARCASRLEPVIRSAWGCTECMRTIYNDVDRVSEVVEAEIQKAIADVELDILK